MNIDDLQPAPYNPRQISEKAKNGLKASLSRFGDIAGIVYNSRTKNLVAGHQRVNQLRSLGAQMVGNEIVVKNGEKEHRFPVRVVDWSESEEKAANVEANNPHIGGDFLNLDKLLSEIAGSIGEQGFLDLRLEELGSMKFSLEGLSLDSEREVLEEKRDDWLKLLQEKYQVKVGQIWQVGESQVLCCDCSDEKEVLRVLDGRQATLVFTDPPYGVEVTSKNEFLNEFGRGVRSVTGIEADDWPVEKLFEFLKSVFVLVREKVVANDCAVFVCSPPGGDFGLMMMTMMRDAGISPRHCLSWVKNAATFSMGRLDYDYQHESIIFSWIKTHKSYRRGKFNTSCWCVDRPQKNAGHPTIKPIELPTNAILNHTDVGDLIYDPFLGSGTTLLAAHATKRIGVGLELEPKYVALTLQRFEDMFKIEPKLIG